MNSTGFKSGLIWMNIGEIAVISGNFMLPVSDSALLEFGTARQSVHLSLFRQLSRGF